MFRNLKLFFLVIIILLSSCKQESTENDKKNTKKAPQKQIKSPQPKRVKKFNVNKMDSLKLLEFYHTFNGENWTEKWNLNESMDNWHGVTLKKDVRTIVELPNNNLKGNVTDFFKKRCSINFKDLSNNQLEGYIFSETNGGEGNLTTYFYKDSLHSGPQIHDSIRYTYINGYKSYNLDGSLHDTLPKFSKLREVKNLSIPNLSNGYDYYGFEGEFKAFKYQNDTVVVNTCYLTPFPNISNQLAIRNNLFLKSGYTIKERVSQDENGTFKRSLDISDYTDYMIFYFEKDIIYDASEGYEWGHRCILIDTTVISFQEAFLIAREFFSNNKTILLELSVARTIPLPYLKSEDYESKPNEYSNFKTIKMDNGKYGFEYSEGEGCFTEYKFSINTEGKYQIESNFGC